MKKGQKFGKLSLLNQIESLKNFNEHRKRVNKSSITNNSRILKKSISFNIDKTNLFTNLKHRREISNEFLKQQKLREYFESDQKMVSRIWRYDQTKFSFSLNQKFYTEKPTLLHHNSKQIQIKKAKTINNENQQIYFRITKAKSLYNQYTPKRSENQQVRKRFHSEFKHYPQQNQTQMDEQRKNTLEHDSEIKETTSKYFEKNIFDNPEQVQRYKKVSKCQFNKISSSGNILCEKLRKQRIAQKILEKKMELQKRIGSRYQK